MRNNYTFFSYTKLFFWLIKTKLFYRKARLIRFPFDVRGKKYIDFGKRITTGIGCRIEAFSRDRRKVLFFGTDVQINDYVHISAMNKVEIGDNVLMASKIYISDSCHGFYNGNANDSSPLVPPIERSYNISYVIIKKNVWIGECVSILPGVVIGEGSVIGANSVVTSDIPDFSIAVGAPAKVIKKYDIITKKWHRV